MNIKKIMDEVEKKMEDAGIENYREETFTILKFVLKKTKVELLLSVNEEVEQIKKAEIAQMLNERIKGMPIQYITGIQCFYGYEFNVNRDVLIPQPDTEILVEEVIKYAKTRKNLKILDLCTGSGCIGVTIKKEVPTSEVYVSDISESALNVAAVNTKKHDVKINFIKSDLFNEIDEKEFDIIISNPPYIETELIQNLSKEVRNEPRVALDGGKNGLDFYKLIAENAKKHLKKKGVLFLEIGYNQAEEVVRILEFEKYSNISTLKDYGNNDRVIISYMF